jgi:hypothetical protein
MLTGLPSLTAGTEASPELPPPQPLTKTRPKVMAIKLRFIVACPLCWDIAHRFLERTTQP